MDHQRQVLRAGAAALMLAISLRLLGEGGFSYFSRVLEDPQALSFLVYLQTGRVVRYPQSVPSASEPDQTGPTQPTQQIELPTESLPVLPVFSAGDLQTVAMTYGCDYRPDLETLLLSPLNWDLLSGEPTVLIVHTHATESYQKTPDEDYVEDGAYRTLDDGYNMVSIGDELARVLEAGGISVIHDRSHHDYPSFNNAYGNSRISIEEYLRQYPSICMVLDIHRDASDSADGGQFTTSGTVGGQDASQLMMVVGTDASGNYHPDWQKNLALALKLSAMLEQQEPGITRPINLRAQRFNMDMTHASLLVEVGAAGDTHDQALLAANALARGILALAKGTG